MNKFSVRWQATLILSFALGLGLSGCALSSSSGGGGSDSSSESEYATAASIAADAISARLVEEGLNQTLADEIASTASEVAIAGMEAEAAGTERVAAGAGVVSAATATELDIPTFLGKMGTGVVTVVQAVEEQLPAELPAADVISAAVEALAEVGGDETIAALLGDGEDITTIGEMLAGEVINSAAALGLFSETDMPAVIAKFSDATMSGVATGGAFSDAAAVQDALDRLSKAAAETIGALYASSTNGTLASALEKLGQGMVQGIQRHPELAQHVDLDDAFESITSGGVQGLTSAGISASTIGAISGQLVQGLTTGALNGLSLPSGGAPAFSVTQINAALSSCGTFLSNALTAAGQSSGTDLSALSGSGTGLVSSISTVISSFSSVSGLSAPSSCTIAVSAPTTTGGGTAAGGAGGTGAVACTPAIGQFAGTPAAASPSFMSEGVDGTSVTLAAVQPFLASSSASLVLGGISYYGAVSSGSPQLKFHVLTDSEFNSLTGLAGIPSSKLLATATPSNASAAWTALPLSLSAPVTLVDGARYYLVITVTGGAYNFYRRQPTGGSYPNEDLVSQFPGTSGNVIQGLKFSTPSSSSVVGAVNRGDDFDLRLFGCQ